ncbi:hypothetical protein AB1Y20_017507 [Prymnesium parvum]|uniref:Uncharacterized protein n=1 Tax=Prymnesium parvum TaxID=97485 RepID=A0AB34JNK2_PRYPA
MASARATYAPCASAQWRSEGGVPLSLAPGLVVEHAAHAAASSKEALLAGMCRARGSGGGADGWREGTECTRVGGRGSRLRASREQSGEHRRVLAGAR